MQQKYFIYNNFLLFGPPLRSPCVAASKSHVPMSNNHYGIMEFVRYIRRELIDIWVCGCRCDFLTIAQTQTPLKSGHFPEHVGPQMLLQKFSWFIFSEWAKCVFVNTAGKYLENSQWTSGRVEDCKHKHCFPQWNYRTLFPDATECSGNCLAVLNASDSDNLLLHPSCANSKHLLEFMSAKQLKI